MMKPTDSRQVWGLLVSPWGTRTHLTEKGKLVIREKPVGLIQEKISTDEFFESPVFALHKPICPLTLWSREKKKKVIFRVTQNTDQIYNLSVYAVA